MTKIAKILLIICVISGIFYAGKAFLGVTPLQEEGTIVLNDTGQTKCISKTKEDLERVQPTVDTICKINDERQMVCEDVPINPKFEDTSRIVVKCERPLIKSIQNFPPQDGHFGRDAASVFGKLNKTGGGSAGFDFSKICNDGSDCSSKSRPGPSSSDWGCNKDNVTGLVWSVKLDSLISPHSSQHSYILGGSTRENTCNNTISNCSVEGYIEEVNSTKLCGLSGWHLPSLMELQSIANYGNQKERLIDLNYFPDTQFKMKGSTTESHFYVNKHYYLNQGWYLVTLNGEELTTTDPVMMFNFNSGTVSNITDEENYYVYLVHSQNKPLGFVDSDNGTITDKATGLIWTKNPISTNAHEAFRLGKPINSSWAEDFSWTEALQIAGVANKINWLGHNDWRLPNIKELTSLLREQQNGQRTRSFWSSTVNLSNPKSVWGVDFDRASIEENSNVLLKVYLVRGGTTLEHFYIWNGEP